MPKFSWCNTVPRSLAGAVFAAILILGGGSEAFAQGAGNSTVTGMVIDSGGVVPGAVVTLTEAAADL